MSVEKDIDDWAEGFKNHTIGQLKTEAIDMAYKFMAKHPNTWKSKLDKNHRYRAVKKVLAIKEEQEENLKARGFES
jgi:hypothetical protein